MITTRLEKPEDIAGIHVVNLKAFGQSVEADLVDQLRQAGAGALSLVAEEAGRIVGHILFTPAKIVAENLSIEGLGLAPMAVFPEFQRKGIGSRLIRHGLALIDKQSYRFVIVLGHPAYYPRFGFERVSRYRIACQWPDVPDEAFMILLFDKAVLRGVSAEARYREEFNAAV